jgi:hypothetical protein
MEIYNAFNNHLILSGDLFDDCHDKFLMAQPVNVSSSVVEKPFSRPKIHFSFKPVS